MDRGDLPGFRQILRRLHTDGRRRQPGELSDAVGELARMLSFRPQGVFAGLALLAGAFVEWGGSPVALAESAPACTLITLQLRGAFSELWPAIGAGRPEPDPATPPPMTELVGMFAAKATDLGLTRAQASAVAGSWFDAPHWVSLMITVMARREFRDAADLLPEVGEVGGGLADRIPRAEWLPGLAQVLDDEPIVAIDQATGRGFRLTMSGIGDNYQLHTLLAHRLIGDPARGLLAGEPPEPAWVAAATNAPPEMPAGELIQRRFQLYDGAGAYVAPEGRPADIAVVDGARVVVLHPPLGNYQWTVGRIYQHMAPTLTLDQTMTAAEAQTWLGRIAPVPSTRGWRSPSQVGDPPR
jgi:hypothetical protein